MSRANYNFFTPSSATLSGYARFNTHTVAAETELHRSCFKGRMAGCKFLLNSHTLVKQN
jgi:hypothetical protein